jgi:hypothetical protein
LSTAATAQDRYCDPGNESCRDILLDYIAAEEVGIDVAFWFMEDARYTAALLRKVNEGVPVRVLMDSRANSTYVLNAQRLAELEDAGIPMRERFKSGILHWKMMLFAGQGVVEFSGANYSSNAWRPEGDPYTNYTDEVIYFTSRQSIVNSFRTKFDDLWLDTTNYRNYANITTPLTRVYGIFPKDPELNFPPEERYHTRAISRYNAEDSKIDVIMFRITDQRHTNAIIAARQRGVPVRLITEPDQYRDESRLWHSWNVDRLYMAGVQIKHRVHAGLNHQKSVILYEQGMTIFGSSNWTSPSSNSQQEHNLFTTNPAAFAWLVDQFERKWNNLSGVIENGPFVPLPPDAPKTPSPAHLSATVSPDSPLTLRWFGGPWAHLYDVYLGTDPANLSPIATNLNLGPSESSAQKQEHTIATPLAPGTTYYWKIVGRTMANKERSSEIWSFTTTGDAPPPVVVTMARQPYLQQVTPNSAVIVWATREPGDALVRFAAGGGPTSTVTATSTLFPATSTGMAADYYQHVARLTGLAPSTTYNYDLIVNGVDVNPVLDRLETAPVKGSGSVTFVAFGDSGTGSTAQRQIASRLDNETFDFALHGGDLTYGNSGGTGDGTHQTLDDWFFSIYHRWLRSRPMFPAMGNHDSRAGNADGRPYRDMFVLPENGASPAFPDHAERYYSFDYGPVHVVVLDTELAFQLPATDRRAAQLAWLEADLAATPQPWKVAVFHRSPYSAGGEHGSDLEVREAFGPIFEEHGVQLVLSAHEHDYERSVPWRAGAPAADGVTYVVIGGGGAPLHPAGTAAWTAHSAAAYHYVRGTAAECTLTLSAIGVDGAAFDSLHLQRCEPPADTEPPVVTISTPRTGSTVAGNTTVSLDASDNVGVVKVELIVDGSVVAEDTTAPFGFVWNSSGVANGSHTLEVRAFDAAGNNTTSAAATVSVNNPTLGAGDILLYAADATVIVGQWTRQPDQTAAGGFSLANTNAGVPKRVLALANPAHYFELTFVAQANVPYRLWIRGKAQGDDWANDSLHIQFSGANGYGIGTTSSVEYNLEDCSGCRLAGWGWQDNGWGVGVLGPEIVFPAGGTQTIRIQPREDGLAVDQIMLSPAKFLGTAPGSLKQDATIYPRSSGGEPPPSDTEDPAVAITSPVNSASVSGTVQVSIAATDNVAVTRVELRVDGALVGSRTAEPFSIDWNTTTVTNGSHTLEARAFDAAGNDASSAPVAVSVSNSAPSDTENPTVAVSSPAAGSTVTGTVTIAAHASDNVGVARVEFIVNGTVAGTDTSSPFEFAWDTTSVANGSHLIEARAFDAAGNSATSAGVAVTVNNSAGGTSDIVLYAADATVVSGLWRRENNATAAGGALLRHPNAGAAKLSSALANPVNYFELTFEAQANVPYHIWIRSKADSDNWANDSLFIQFSGGSPYAIGTTTSVEYNLEDCSGCRLAGWGWQDNGWGVGVMGPHIVFPEAGTHTIRIQTREDGLSIDQIILSPVNFLEVPPGGLKNDNTIYPRSGGTVGPGDPPASDAAEIVLYAAHATSLAGEWRTVADATAAGGSLVRHPDAGASKLQTALASPVNYVELTFAPEADVPYHLWIRGKAEDDDWANDSVFVQFSDHPEYAIGTTSAVAMNLEDCSGCRLEGWGWQDNGWGVGVAGPDIVFPEAGPQTMRIQTREDGLSIDQIVLSAETYKTDAPGALKNDSTILPERS